MTVHALTLDVEDWRQIVHWKMTGESVRPDRKVVAETDTILELLADRGVRGTFFILANVARHYPDLIRRIAREGHEIGSHGLSHQLVFRQDRSTFYAETREAKALLEDVTGTPILGYRAAEFSITRGSPFAFEVLAELGFVYDSSVFPIRSRRYGVEGMEKRPHRVETAAGEIVEFPMTSITVAGRELAVGGGGHFRLLPYAATAFGLSRAAAEDRPGIVYLHPYEFSKEKLRPLEPPRDTAARKTLLRHTLVHNFGLPRLRTRFDRLLEEFDFQPLKEFLSDEQWRTRVLGPAFHGLG